VEVEVVVTVVTVIEVAVAAAIKETVPSSFMILEI